MGVRALVVGAISLDLDSSRGGVERRPGGVVVHAGIALARLGAHTRVITRARSDELPALLAPLHAEGVETSAHPSRVTTVYHNDYSGEVDRHELEGESDPIGPEHIPAGWEEADVIQLGPLHPRDVLPETAAALRGFKGVDLQGLVRAPGSGGARLRSRRDLARFLAEVSVVQVSESELEAVLEGETLEHFVRRHGIQEMIVTRGARGALVLTPRGEFGVPATPVVPRFKVGAGDAFLATYLFVRSRGAPPRAAAREVARACAIKLERGESPKGLSVGEDM